MSSAKSDKPNPSFESMLPGKTDEALAQNMVTDAAKAKGKKGEIVEIPLGNKEVLKQAYREEDGDTFLFTDLFYDKYLFDHAAGVWYYWNDNYWREDKIKQYRILMEKVIVLYKKQIEHEKAKKSECGKVKDDEGKKKHTNNIGVLRTRISSLRSPRQKKAIADQAACGLNSLGDTGEGWDTKPMILGYANGTIDLLTGRHKQGDPKDRIMAISPIKWDAKIPVAKRHLESHRPDCPTWKSFMLQIMGGDQSMVDYLQRLLGYGITGLTTEHIYPIFWGPAGRNGKGTILETLKSILGPMAYKAPSQFFMQQSQGKGSGAPDSALMRFRGARIVWGSETNEGDRLDAAKLKELVGGDTISARPPYGKRQIEFRPTHLLLLLTNMLPMVPANDKALWRRIHLIKFNYSFLPNPDPDNPYELAVDKELGEKLLKESAGILSWLVDGCRIWQDFGLMPPDAVNSNTREYQKDEDILGHFVDERCETGDPKNNSYRVTPKNLYNSYRDWCEEVGHRAMARKRFLDDMRERFKTRKSGVVYFLGVLLKNEY